MQISTTSMITAAFAAGFCLLAADLARAQDSRESRRVVQRSDIELRDYVVKEGDSCISIAKRELGDRRDYRVIHRHNPDLGPTPHELEAGMVLRLPKRSRSAPDAHLTEQRGKVNVRQPAHRDWSPADTGMGLFRTWRVNAREHSTAEITFRDDSAIRMRENTIVIIYGASKGKARRETTTASLERGTLRSRLSELDRGRLKVTTPSSEAELGAGSALVSVDADGTSRFANHQGKPARVRSRSKRRSRAVKVAAGMGSKVERGKRPSKPRPLPPSPAWNPGERAFVGWSDRGGVIRGSWASVAQAATYRVEIASDPAMKSVLARVVVPARITELEAHRLPPGTFHVTVSAIDGDGFESRPSSVTAMQVVGLERTLSGQISEPSDDAGGAAMLRVSRPADPVAVLPGTEISAPPGVACRVDDPAGDRSDPPSDPPSAAPAGAALALTEPGVRQIHCRTAEGEDLGVVTVEVARVAVRTEIRGQAGMQALPRNRSTTLELTVNAGAAELPVLSLRAPRGIAVGDIESVSDGRLRVDITPGYDAPDSAELEVVAGDGTGGAESVSVLARVTVEVAVATLPSDPPPEPVAITLPAPRIIAQSRGRIDLFGAFATRSSDLDLGLQTAPGAVVNNAPLVGLRLGYAVHPRVIIETELTVARPSLSLDLGSGTLIGYRGHLRVPILRLGRVAPFALAGVGGQAWRSAHIELGDDTSGAAYYGLGAQITGSRTFGLRLDARHELARGREQDVVSNVEVQLGVSWSL